MKILNLLPILASKLNSFTGCRKGNFAMMTAVIAPVALGAGSLALDFANMTALKGSLQAASDSVSLAVATRIAKGNLAVSDAENFASALLLAQMENENDRFFNLVVTPSVNIIEDSSSGVTTWDVEISGIASQDTTPLAAFFGKPQLSVSISSTATTGTEEIQGALSMAVVVDVSGSMGSNIGGSSTAVQTALDVSSSEADTIISYINTVMSSYDLTEENIIYILENYTAADCDEFYNGNGNKTVFLNGINKPTSTSYYDTYLYCAYPLYAAEYYGTNASALIANLSSVIDSAPTTKIDALKSAAASLFAQFDAADPDKKYVRTGLIAYSSSVQGSTNMEWGASSAASYAATLSANGGTASTSAVKWAYDKLKTSVSTEATEHLNKNGQAPSRFILFMTDGDNNYSSDDTSTKSYCDQAKTDGIEIYSVAFAAPEGGQELLNYCASPTGHYFEPETASELIAAFTNIGAATSKSATRLVN